MIILRINNSNKYLSIKRMTIITICLYSDYSIPRKSEASYTTLPAKCCIPNDLWSTDLGSKSLGLFLCWDFTFLKYSSTDPLMEHSTSNMLNRPVLCVEKKNVSYYKHGRTASQWYYILIELTIFFSLYNKINICLKNM